MTGIDDHPVTTADRYARAAATSDLTPGSARVRSDADVLLAAGIAAGKDERRKLALAAYRLGLSGDTAGLGPLVDEMDEWLQSRLSRGGNRPMPAAARRQLILDTLQWWFNPTCGYCNGNGFVLAEGTSRLSPVACDACFGSTKRSLRKEIHGPRAWADHAEWLADELGRLVGLVFCDMARLLNGKIDEALGAKRAGTS